MSPAAPRLRPKQDQGEENLLTGAELPFEAQAVEVVTLAVLPPHLTELVGVAGALSAQTVAPAAADGAVGLGDAVGVVGRAVVLHRALAAGAEATLVALAHAALVRAVAGAAERAVGLGRGLAVAAAGEVHGDLQGVLEAPRLDGEGASLLLGAAAQLGLHAEGHLRTRRRTQL